MVKRHFDLHLLEIALALRKLMSELFAAADEWRRRGDEM